MPGRHGLGGREATWRLKTAKTMKRNDFRALAVRALRLHRYCGDAYPEDGWPEVNAALAQYALENRRPNTALIHGTGSGWCNCPPDTEIDE